MSCLRSIDSSEKECRNKSVALSLSRSTAREQLNRPPPRALVALCGRLRSYNRSQEVCTILNIVARMYKRSQIPLNRPAIADGFKESRHLSTTTLLSFAYFCCLRYRRVFLARYLGFRLTLKGGVSLIDSSYRDNMSFAPPMDLWVEGHDRFGARCW